MCNDYEQHVRWADYRKMMQALDLAIPSHQTELDLPQADDIRINDMGPVIRAAGKEIELVPMTFAFPPARPGGAPVFNFRSEGRHFANSNRCLIPASAFFEFTGKKYPKAKHRFALKGSPITAIAGLWREAQGNHPPTFTMLTTTPGPDVAPFHNRQVVVLQPENWSAWLHLTKPETELLRPLSGGSLDVTTVREGSEKPPPLFLLSVLDLHQHHRPLGRDTPDAAFGVRAHQSLFHHVVALPAGRIPPARIAGRDFLPVGLTQLRGIFFSITSRTFFAGASLPS
jgi:putative SOS response-associated peptidase YedK